MSRLRGVSGFGPCEGNKEELNKMRSLQTLSCTPVAVRDATTETRTTNISQTSSQVEIQLTSRNVKNPGCGARSHAIAMMSFPQKLMTLLIDGRYNHIVSWTPNGKAFTVHSINEFSMTILPLFSTKLSFTRFVRKLERWGFSQLPSKKDRLTSITFFHEKFQEGDFILCSQIVRRQTVRPKPISKRSGHPAYSACLSPQSSLDEDAYSPYAHFAELARNLKKLYCDEDSSVNNNRSHSRRREVHGLASETLNNLQEERELTKPEFVPAMNEVDNANAMTETTTMNTQDKSHFCVDYTAASNQ